MKPIGGYFELELPAENPTPLALGGVRVGSGRNALEYILRGLASRMASKIYLPWYTCEVVLQPIQALGLKYEFYPIDKQLRIADHPALKDGEYIIVNNYFGILDSYVKDMTDLYAGRIIVDNSQALMAPVLPGQMAFYSPRKFVGVPDGGIACTPDEIEITERVSDQESTTRSSHLLKRRYGSASYGYEDFRHNDETLNNMPLKRMSVLTETMLDSLDFNHIVRVRKENYDTLRGALEPLNVLATPPSSEISCPMIYPFLTADPGLKTTLIRNQVFVATYWPNVLDWCKPESAEAYLANHLIPLPIDQRYSVGDMIRIAEIINNGKI